MVEQKVYLFLHKKRAESLGLSIDEIDPLRVSEMGLQSGIVYMIKVGNETIPLFKKLDNNPEYEKKTVTAGT